MYLLEESVSGEVGLHVWHESFLSLAQLFSIVVVENGGADGYKATAGLEGFGERRHDPRSQRKRSS